MSYRKSALRPRGAGSGGRQALLFSWFALPAAAIIALLLGAALMLAFGASPVTGYHDMLTGAFSGT